MRQRYILAIFFFLTAATGSAADEPSSKPAVHEAGFVKMGAIEQWITIDGNDSANPVVLILHGGPSDALSPYADGIFAGWDKNFVMVQWDQRGSGRTYGTTGAAIEATMHMSRMTQDGIDVSEYLTHHLHKKKIIIVGGSWGSILGVYLADTRPVLFYAVVV